MQVFQNKMLNFMGINSSFTPWFGKCTYCIIQYLGQQIIILWKMHHSQSCFTTPNTYVLLSGVTHSLWLLEFVSPILL